MNDEDLRRRSTIFASCIPMTDEGGMSNDVLSLDIESKTLSRVVQHKYSIANSLSRIQSVRAELMERENAIEYIASLSVAADGSRLWRLELA